MTEQNKKVKRVLLVASVSSHISQFHRPLVDMLHKHGVEVHAASHNNLNVKPGLDIDFVDKTFEIPFSRSLLDTSHVKAYRKIKELIDSGDYDIIHCNTPIASVITRLAARKARRQGAKVIYTAHGFQFFKGSSKLDWLIFYPIEKIMSRYTDLIFTINKEDYQRALNFHTSKVVYIPGVGVDTERFRKAEPMDLCKEYNIPKDAYIMLTVGELFPRKNQKVLIDAMMQLRDKPIYLLICGNGILEDELKKQCKENGVEDRVIFAGYTRNIPAIMKSCKLFLFPSVREGLGLAGIEAMAAGLPVISSNINGIRDYMIDGKMGYMCDPHDTEAFAKAILKLYNDNELCEVISAFNMEHAKKFDYKKSEETIEEGYRLLHVL